MGRSANDNSVQHREGPPITDIESDLKVNECSAFGMSFVDVPSLIAAIRDLETLAPRRISCGRRRPPESDRGDPRLRDVGAAAHIMRTTTSA
jgi:hypothetical protein